MLSVIEKLKKDQELLLKPEKFLIVALLSSFLRTFFEWFGDSGKTFVYATSYGFAGFFNTLSWFLYLTLFNTLFVAYFLELKEKKVNLLLALNIYITAPIFVMVGLFDSLFSYNNTMLPVWYNFKYFIFPIYMPIGCLFGFLFLVPLFSWILKKTFFENKRGGFLVTFYVFFCAILTFMYGYQICLWFPFYVIHSIHETTTLVPVFTAHHNIENPLKAAHVIFEAFLFLIPVVWAMPYLIDRLVLDRNRKKGWKLIYVFLIILLFIFFYETVLISNEYLSR